MGVLDSVKPRPELMKGDLEDALFAADFGDVISGAAPKVYQDPATFFQNTHPARALCKVIQTVFERLCDAKEPGATIRLSTGFGGGKTHALIAMWHLARNVRDPSLGTHLLPAAQRPPSVTVVGVDAGKAGVPVFSTHGALKIHSLWGEVFYQLGGEKAFKTLGKADHPEASPSEGQVLSVLPKGPVLLLFDELVIYMARLSPRGQGNLLGFLTTLSSIASKRPQTVLVITDPARQAAYQAEAAALAQEIEQAAIKLQEVGSRKASDYDPVGDESPQIIARRLFERVDKTAAEAASAEYRRLYQRLADETGNPLFKKAATAEYAQRIVECYPFHPRLLDTARDRLSAMSDFQRSRGVLRLFTRILRDISERKEELDLISAGDINWSNPSIQAELLHRLQRDGFRAAVSADIEKHAQELDGGGHRGIHTRVASALLLESLPLQPNSGLDKADLTLAVLRPEESGAEAEEALDRLLGICWHTYPMPGDRGYQFRYEPNVAKQIEDRMRDVPWEDAKSRVLADVQEYFSGPWKVAAWPESARDVADIPALQLVLCEDAKTAEAVTRYSDDSNPQAPMPRRFRNGIVAVAPTPEALQEAISRAQRLMAAELIEKEADKLAREQLQRMKPVLQKRFRVQARRAFDQIFLASGYAGRLEEKYQVPEDEILKGTYGQPSLKRFLEEKKLIYKSDDILDVDLFLEKVLRGATPVSEAPDVYTAKAIRDRFFAAPGLRLIDDSHVIRKTIIEAVAQGKLVLRFPDGRTYDSQGVIEGPEGQRRRASEPPPGSFSLDETVQLTPAGSATAQQWTTLDAGKPPGEGITPPPPPPPPIEFESTDWSKVIRLAGTNRLVELRLTAHSPAAAENLAELAQPLGGERVELTVQLSGRVKDDPRGNINFLAKGLRLSHSIRPLEIAQKLFRALAEDASYEAQVCVHFGPSAGTRSEAALSRIRERAPEEVSVWARFEPVQGSSV